MIYLGTLDYMVGLQCPSTQSVSHTNRVSTVTTVEGRVKAMVAGESGRSWALGLPDGAQQAASGTLQEFVAGAWGPGPFIFVPADAPLTNLLSPREAAALVPSSNASVGGPVDLGADGWAASSLIVGDPESSTESYANTDPVPVLEGRAVTGSAWIRPGFASPSLLRLYWRGRDGAGAGTSSVSVSAGSGLQRVTITEIPPAGAVGVRLVAYKAELMTRPQITWTDDPVPWAAGEGCPQAVVHDLSRTQTTAWPGTVMSSAQYTITEVM